MELADWGNWALFLTGQIDSSREWGNEMMEKHPGVGFITSAASIGVYMAGDFARAVNLAEKGRLLEDSPLAQIILAQAYGYNGEKEKVRPLLELAARAGVYTCPYESAVGYLTVGETETAMGLLEEAYEKRSNCLVFLRVDPRLAPVRESERFRGQYLDLMARAGLDDEAVRSDSAFGLVIAPGPQRGEQRCWPRPVLSRSNPRARSGVQRLAGRKVLFTLQSVYPSGAIEWLA